MLGFTNFEKHYLCYIYFVLIGVAIYGVASDQSACEKKILKDYPEAECSVEKDKDTCRFHEL